jgi:diacylglycerol kinase (ATP)
MQQPEKPPVIPKRVTVILNPAAGGGQRARRRAELEQLLAQTAREAAFDSSLPPIEWEIIQTAGPHAAANLAAEAAARGSDLIVAAGGDGTCGDVVNGLVGTNARLGVIPLGTGNDFIRCLGLDNNLSRAVHTLFYGKPRPVDLGLTQGRWFINIAGCGFDAVVAERMSKGFRYLRGTPAYVAAVCQCLLSFRPSRMWLTINGERLDVMAMLCAVANAQYYGGGMCIAPDARIDDGLLDVCIVGDMGRLEFLRAFPQVFKGAHVTHPKVTMLRGRHVTIESDMPLPVLVDGDVLTNTPVEFTLVSHAIHVMAPPTP